MSQIWRWVVRKILRYASLYFCCAIEQEDNELICLEVVHRYVELLDKYFGSVSWHLSLILKCRFFLNFQLKYRIFQVCELDIIFNFEKAYFILDEFLLAGEIQVERIDLDFANVQILGNQQEASTQSYCRSGRHSGGRMFSDYQFFIRLSSHFYQRL